MVNTDDSFYQEYITPRPGGYVLLVLCVDSSQNVLFCPYTWYTWYKRLLSAQKKKKNHKSASFFFFFFNLVNRPSLLTSLVRAELTLYSKIR